MNLCWVMLGLGSMRLGIVGSGQVLESRSLVVYHFNPDDSTARRIYLRDGTCR